MHRIEVLIPALRSFWPQALAGLVSIGVLAWGAILFSSPHNSGILKVAVTAIGAFGLSGATISAKASAAVSDLTKRFGAAIATDQLVEAGTFVPKPKGLRHRFSYSPGRFAAPLDMSAIDGSGLS
jgi:hypothetical protein